MMKKQRNISTKGYSGSESNESVRSNYPRVSSSVSSMFLQNIGSSKPEVTKIEENRLIKSSTRTILPVNARERKTLPTISGIPEDVAVHFGNFYCLGKESGNNGAWNAGTSKTELPVRHSPRSEFTRQMVHNLERLAGTEYYARQISALLEETVESPNYVVKQPPDDNFLPYERFDPTSYPLWYKDPDRINYRSPRTESSTSIETTRAENVPTREMQLGEGATSDCTLINTMSNIVSRGSLNITDCGNNYESSSISSEITSNSMENTGEESDYDEVKVKIFVK